LPLPRARRPVVAAKKKGKASAPAASKKKTYGQKKKKGKASAPAASSENVC
jgi:hypothetical protein